MAGIQLNNGLIRAIEKIVTQFGVDVLVEDRFVNILHDMYPDRDNPAVFRIIKSMVDDGYCSDLLKCNKINIHNYVSKSTLALNQKNGYDKNLVENLLYSIALGSGVVLQKDISAQASPSPSQNMPARQKPATPQQNKYNSKAPNTPLPNMQKPKGSLFSSYRLFNIFYLTIAFLGLFIAPVIYLLAITGVWWPSFTLFLILIIQAIIFSVSYKQLMRNKPLPVIGGSFSAIILCGFIFYAFAPFYADGNSTKEVICYLGLPYGHEMAVPVITLIISTFYFGYINIGGRIAGYDLTLILDKMGDKYSSVNGKTEINRLINNKKFMKGFLLSCLFIWLTGVIVMHLPTLDLWRIDLINILLRNDRSSEYKQLSFAGFRIGSDMDSCNNVARTHSEYIYGGIEAYKNMGNSNAVVINDYSFDSFDSTMYVKSKWYEDTVDISIHSLKGKVMAIFIPTDYYSQYKIRELFSQKYGQPERKRYKKYKTVIIENNYYDIYTWTYKNGIIQIEPFRIIYYDRYIETVAKQNKEKEEQEALRRKRIKQMEKEKEAERQRKQDSLDNIKKIEEEKKREYERKKAIDQI